MRSKLAKISSGLGGLLLVATLAACGNSDLATSKPLLNGTSTPTTGPSVTATTARPGLGGPPATPIFSKPSDGTPGILPQPSGTTFLTRPSGSPSLPIIGGQPTVTPSANALAPNSDGSCPDTHPIKASMVGPLKTYFTKDQTGYNNARATECFAKEADAEAAGYRKSGR
ncbi:MAG: hypothetical protein U0232_30995 [Thermomicrobiales bacterium]